MPIKPENKKRYPANWKDIRKDILKRADNKCEFCGIENYTIRENGSKVVLTIAHLDHTPENCDYSNLRALCQKCTLCYETENDDEYLCCATRKLLPDGAKPDWCPLRELPERKETHTVLELNSIGRWTEGAKAGFNICLDEILEERKE